MKGWAICFVWKRVKAGVPASYPERAEGKTLPGQVADPRACLRDEFSATERAVATARRPLCSVGVRADSEGSPEMPALSSAVRSLFAWAGFSIERLKYGYTADRRANIARAGIDLVIDVGANEGQYATELRRQGFHGSILSLEPLPDAFERLSALADADKSWTAINAAAGATPGRAELYVSQDSVCSSLLRPTSSLIDAIPMAQTTQTIPVDIVRLDEIALPAHSRLMLKLDVQGFEEIALQGAKEIHRDIRLLEIELGIEQGYENGYGFVRALPEIDALGFRLVSLNRGATNSRTGRLIDIDVLFARD